MSVPFKPFFDRYAQTSFGLVAYGLGNGVGVNGVALVTEFLYGQNYFYCEDPVVTNWSLCPSVPVTSWTGVSLPTTIWTYHDGS